MVGLFILERNCQLNYLDSLNPQQFEVAKIIKGKRIVNAAAGSGKTSTVVSNVRYTIDSGVDPGNILMFTFTRKAALEMKERLKKAIGPLVKKVTIGTYHSFACTIIRRFISLTPYASNFTIISPDDMLIIVKEISGVKDDIANLDFLRFIEEVKSNFLSPDELLRHEEYKNKTKNIIIYREYQRRLVSENTMDFNDLLFQLHILMKDQGVLDYLHSRYKYIWVDEMQDSSRKDLELIFNLMGNNENVCGVMDNNQSIYKFRGAEIDKVILMLKKNNFKEYQLERNYRSTQTIVNASNSVIDKNPMLIKKNAYSAGEIGTKVQIKQLFGQQEESEFILKTILSLQQKNVALHEIAILARTKGELSRIEKLFLSNSIPHTLYSGLAFMERAEIKNILSFLRFLYNPKDETAFARIVNIPRSRIGEKSVAKILALKDNGDYVDIVDCVRKNLNSFKDATKNGLQTFLERFDLLKLYAEKNVLPAAIIDKYIEVFKYKDFIKTEYKEIEDWSFRLNNVTVFEGIASNYYTLEEFLTGIIEAIPSSEKLEDAGVTLMTVHASKGLEFRVVLIMGASEGLFPHAMSMDTIEDIHEERRLWYVAMTRAKELLLITSPKTSISAGTIKFHNVSRFVNEIDSKYKLFYPYIKKS